MGRKVIVLSDPGIDGAFAIALALHDRKLDCVGLAATAGNVSADQANRNMQILVDVFDPPRRPRFGAALPVEYDVDGLMLHGPGGLGGTNFPCAELHHTHAADKLIVDLVRQHPKELTILVLGPLTVLARALDRDPEMVALVDRVVCVGGAWHEAGNISAVAEFHFYCDPASARQVVNSGMALTLIPLDVTRKLVLAPTELSDLSESQTCSFLRQIVPYGIQATASLYGIEGFHLKDVLGVAAVAVPQAFTIKSVALDVETQGELTRGMTIVDTRWNTTAKANVDLALSVDVNAVRRYMTDTLAQST
ncbi:MAG: nucleoside hydrolase [Gemmataceae bacterium]